MHALASFCAHANCTITYMMPISD